MTPQDYIKYVNKELGWLSQQSKPFQRSNFGKRVKHLYSHIIFEWRRNSDFIGVCSHDIYLLATILADSAYILRHTPEYKHIKIALDKLFYGLPFNQGE